MVNAGIQTGGKRRQGYAAVGCLVILIVLAWSGVGAAEILNPDFEMTYPILPKPRVRPEMWSYVSHPSFDFYCTDLWKTEGGLAAGLYSKLGRAFLPGNRHAIRQYVDLTGLRSIVFDVRLAAYPAGVFEHFEASFCVDGEVLWRQSVDGEYRDQQAEVSHLPGWHWIELRETALDNVPYGPAAYWVQWDNLRVVEAPSVIEAYVVLNPATLHVHSCGKWVTCYIELAEGYDVHDIDGATVTLQDIPAYMGDEAWAVAGANEENVRDFDGDFDLERMVRFDRAATLEIVQPPEATLTVKGRLTSGVAFEGAVTVRVVDNLMEPREKNKCKENRNGPQGVRDRLQEAREKCREREGRKPDADDKNGKTNKDDKNHERK